MSAPELSQEERAVLARHRESQRKRGAYWLTPEGREELREVFDNPNDGSAVRPLLDALEAAECERDHARRLLHRLAVDVKLSRAGFYVSPRLVDDALAASNSPRTDSSQPAGITADAPATPAIAICLRCTRPFDAHPHAKDANCAGFVDDPAAPCLACGRRYAEHAASGGKCPVEWSPWSFQAPAAYYCENRRCTWRGYEKPRERRCPACGAKVWKDGTAGHKPRPALSSRAASPRTDSPHPGAMPAERDGAPCPEARSETNPNTETTNEHA